MKSIKEAVEKRFKELPEKIIQFGEGNFLRAFADWFVEKANANGIFNGSVVLVKPTSRKARLDFNAQNSMYTVLERGRENGEKTDRSTVVTSISRFISAYNDSDELLKIAASEEISVVISNTTEAGITYVNGEKFEDFPNVSYPAKLCRLLYERFSKLGFGSGLLILPVELIEDNGVQLKKCVISYAEDWALGEDFVNYIEKDCKFCSTLVDRIVTGFPEKDYNSLCERLGYTDKLMVACEPYHSWIIEGKEEWKDRFPIDRISNCVQWVKSIAPYRERKVKILNGAHTMSVLAAYLCGFDIVRDMMHDSDFYDYLNLGIENEIIPTIDMDKAELEQFKNSVFERFDNPFIDHKLLDISLNSVSKFKARCLPSVLQYIEEFNTAPPLLSFALAALIRFYNGKFDENGDFVSYRSDEKYCIRDSEDVLKAFDSAFKTQDPVKRILADESLWGMDLTAVCDLADKVKAAFEDIETLGMRAALKKVCGNE